MVRPVKVRKVGASLGVVLPKELLAELDLGEGDTLYPVRTPDGVELTRYDPESGRLSKPAGNSCAVIPMP